MHQTIQQPTLNRTARVLALRHGGESGPAAIAQFLPPRTAANYVRDLVQLVTADVYARREMGDEASWAEYRAAFVELPADEPGIADQIATSVVELSADLSQTPPPTPTAVVRVLALDDAPAPLPKVGEEFGGFTLVDLLGRGAFGSVFLAQEHRLAQRNVALKITRKPNNESQRLARLQHTNIVPITTAFKVGTLHVVQMPYFGRQTLADLIDYVRHEKGFPKIGGEVFASTQMRASTSHGTMPATGSEPASAPAHEPASAVHKAKSHPNIEPSAFERSPAREMLARMNYVDAVTWIVSRLADGLAHAHAKEILHLDLKPHNVLLSDDGQPMLLDFNLAYDVKNQDRDRVGGTWPYMAPEQIREYAHLPGTPVNERADLYALGVMFFELLTLRHPFAPVRATPAGLQKALIERQSGAPCVRSFNPTVPPSIAAVVRKLLAPNPADRYASAAALREDLLRHGESRPLAHAPDRSVRERITKWHRRYPRASLTCALVAVVFGLTLGGMQMLAWSKDRQKAIALATAADFNADLARFRVDLVTFDQPDLRSKAVATASDWLKKYEIGTSPDWADGPLLRLLPDDARAALHTNLGELCLLAAHAEWLDGRHRPAAEKAVRVAHAVAFNKTAEAILADAVPAVFVDQRNELAAAGGDVEPGAARPIAATDAVDEYLRACRLMSDGQYALAAKQLETLTEQSPDHFGGQFLLAVCYQTMGQGLRAAERFQISKPLSRSDARPAISHGIVLFRMGRWMEAETDFTDAIRRQPERPMLRYQRAIVRRSRGDLPGAVADLTAELELNPRNMIVLCVRANVFDHLKDADAANRDRAAFDRFVPANSAEFVASGNRWLATDPQKALGEYDRALALDPDCVEALQDKAHVLSDVLHKTPEALVVSGAAVKVAPGFSRIRAGYAVLLARAGRRAEAHAEIEKALNQGCEPENTYQAANVYALTSTTHPEDADRAVALFRQCLREGYSRFQLIGTDPDMTAIRDRSDYKDALKAAMDLIR